MKNHLVGIVANGLVSVKGGADSLTRRITTRLAINGDLNNPFSYLNEKYLEKASSLDLLGDNLSESHRANFRYGFEDISSVNYDPSKKWGMGYYPHNGKVYITTHGKTREFIILGNQSGLAISERINNAIESANNQLNQDAPKSGAPVS